jgi:hypothetical protein
MQKIKTSSMFAVFVASVLLQHAAFAQNKIPASVLSNGVTNSANSSNRITGTVGQPAIGAGKNSSVMINAGFWHVPNQILFSPPPASWSFVSNTGGNATIAVPAAINPTIGAQPLQTGDAVGVFFVREGSLVCGGFGIWSEGRNLPITAWADNPQTTVKDGFAPGEMILYKIWDESAQREHTAIATYKTGGPNFTIDGLYELSSLNGITGSTHAVALSQGWNTISSFIQPATPALETLLSGVVANLVIMKNGAGQVFWPEFAINTIGSWNHLHGYQVFMKSAATLSIVGTEIAPQSTPITLSQGWNLAAYLRSSPQNIQTALAGIAGNLVIVKNNAGEVFWPEFGINTIGAMQPGQGYQINVKQATTLTYPANSSSSVAGSISPSADLIEPDDHRDSPRHYSSVANTGVSATLLIESADLAEGDEIAVENSTGRLIGSGVMRRSKALLTVWGDDRTTKEILDGATEQEELSLKVWQKSEGKEKALRISSLTDAAIGAALEEKLRYESNAVWVAKLSIAKKIPAHFSLQQNYPNPFNPSTLIKYGLPSDANVELHVYNLLGQRVAVIVDQQQEAGYHEVVFQNQALPSGVYFYRLQAGSFTQTKKMLIVR